MRGKPYNHKIVNYAGTKYQPQVIPKVKVLPLHWQKIPPISVSYYIYSLGLALSLISDDMIRETDCFSNCLSIQYLIRFQSA